METIRDMITPLRTAWAIEKITPSCGLLKGKPYMAIVGPHRKSTISDLTMGRYQNYDQTEITVSKFKNGSIRVSSSTCYNNHTFSGSTSVPYNPSGELRGVPIEERDCVHALISELLSQTEVYNP